MTTTCTRIEPLLQDGGAPAMDSARRHASECDPCGRTLAAWEEISAAASGLRVEWESPELWPRIERALREEKASSSGSPVAPIAALRSARYRVWQIAAGVILLLGLGIVSWRVLETRPPAGSAERWVLEEAALREVEQAEQNHLQAIERLSKMVGPGLDEASTPLMLAYREKVMLLDDAIAELESNIDLNRQNAHLRRELLAVYGEKQRTLQAVLHEERRTNESN